MGCFKVSQGCTHCYADELTSKRMGLDVFGHDTSKRKRTSARTWANPVTWNRQSPQKFGRPSRVFCASLADVFEDAPGPNEWRKDLWELVHRTPWLDWQILTKRPENITRMLPDLWDRNRWGFWPNVWLGTSIEDNRVAERAPILTAVPALIHFISYEPAIGPGNEIPLEHIEWLIYGAESGPKYRKHDITWALEMWSRCQTAGVAYFFKQGNGLRSDMNIDELGRVVREFPVSWSREEMTNAA